MGFSKDRYITEVINALFSTRLTELSEEVTLEALIEIRDQIDDLINMCVETLAGQIDTDDDRTSYTVAGTEITEDEDDLKETDFYQVISNVARGAGVNAFDLNREVTKVINTPVNPVVPRVNNPPDRGLVDDVDTGWPDAESMKMNESLRDVTTQIYNRRTIHNTTSFNKTHIGSWRGSYNGE